MMKKEEGLKGNRTVKNGSKPSIYKGFQRKENEKRKKKRRMEVYMHKLHRA